jgi:tRNA-dihydrouridine synthase
MKTVNDLVSRLAEDSGAAAVTLHGRTREQRYSKAADWEKVGELVRLRGIPVYGNGDILTWYEAKTRREVSSAAGRRFPLVPRVRRVVPFVSKLSE